ncbi:hypothetical protein CYMTET_45912 [Cymbomonas tetramitiformis]|uniref:Uncharacterized protein n=1 Tax=Cymbomonas tetramitiformis TaxID=36881 RepID=A0AAE0BYN2_9CHLO|nr:hypothetical protein CYMTET_45912 [Cymbomonas tetramitiformis]
MSDQVQRAVQRAKPVAALQLPYDIMESLAHEKPEIFYGMICMAFTCTSLYEAFSKAASRGAAVLGREVFGLDEQENTRDGLKRFNFILSYMKSGVQTWGSPPKSLALSCGSIHSAIILNRSLWTFGCGREGILGHGDEDLRPAPRRTPSPEAALTVSAGDDHTVIVSTRGEVLVCGRNMEENDDGEQPTSRKLLSPTLLKSFPGIRIVCAAAGGGHTLALSDTGAVYSWGENSYGQLGWGLAGRPSGPWAWCHETPRRLDGLPRCTHIAAGRFHSVAIAEEHPSRPQGGAAELHAAAGGVVTRSRALHATSPSLSLPHSLSPPGHEEERGPAPAQSSEAPSSPLYCWGLNHAGQAGVTASAAPESRGRSRRPRSAGEGWLSVAMDHQQHIARPTVVNIPFRQMEYPTCSSRGEAGSSEVLKQVACGEAHTLVLTAGGQIFAFGDNVHGQLGIDVTREWDRRGTRGESGWVKMPEEAGGPSARVTAVAAGAFHSVARTSAGHCLTWGRSKSGQLGHSLQWLDSIMSSDANVRRPELVKGLKGIDVIMIAAGARHTVAVGNASSSAKEAGVSSHANRTFSLESSPRAAELEDIDSCCVPAESLEFFSWGSALHGQLGTGKIQSSFVPQKIAFP